MLKKMILAFVLSALSFGLYMSPAQAMEELRANETSSLHFLNGALQTRVVWEKGPIVGDESILRLEFFDVATQMPVELSVQIKVTLWMPLMGHGSAPTVIQRVSSDDGVNRAGVYQVSNMYFTMPGVWEVRVRLKDASGMDETQVLTVSLDGASEMGHAHHH